MFVIILLLGLVASSHSSFLGNETGPALVQSRRAIAPRALSGSTTKDFNKGYRMHLEWTGSQDQSTLKTTVKVTFYVELLNTAYGMYNKYTSGSSAPKLTITIDGTTAFSEVKTFDFRSKSVGYTDAKGSGSKAVSHDAYGSAKSISISASLNTNIDSTGTMSISSTASLSSIPVKVTVNFNGNGGTASKSSMTVTYDSKYGALPTASRTGYNHKGWFTATSGGSQITSSSTVSVIKTQTLYAQWTVNIYLVEFDGNEGIPSELSMNVTYDEVYGELPTATRDGFTFVGWFTDPYAGAEITSVSTVSITTTQTLYAQWTVNRISITFTNPGCPEIEPIYQDHGTEITLPVPNKAGHTFINWLDENEVVFTATKMPAESVTLHPLYVLNNYTIFIHIDGGVTELEKPYGTVIDLPVPATSIEGHTFDGWEDLEGENYTDNYTVYGDDNLTSIWVLNVYTATFVVSSEQKVSIRVGYGTVIEPPTVENPGYSFMGWCLGEENCKKVMDFAKETMPAMDIELYPKWEFITKCVEIVIGSGGLDEWKNRITELAEDTTSDFIIVAFVDDDDNVHIIVKFEDVSQSETFYRACVAFVNEAGSVKYVSAFETDIAVGCSVLSKLKLVVFLMMFYSMIF